MWVKHLDLGLGIVGYLIPVCVLAFVGWDRSISAKIVYRLGFRVPLAYDGLG